MNFAKNCLSITLLATPLIAASPFASADWRQGASVGGTHMVGYDLEIPIIGPLRLETSVGLWEWALSTSETVKQYHENRGYNFFYGGGFWQVTALTPDEGGMINLIRAVIGAEWPLNRDTVWGAELSANYPYPDKKAQFWGDDSSNEFNRRVVIPLPRLYYRWEF